MSSVYKGSEKSTLRFIGHRREEIFVLLHQRIHLALEPHPSGSSRFLCYGRSLGEGLMGGAYRRALWEEPRGVLLRPFHQPLGRLSLMCLTFCYPDWSPVYCVQRHPVITPLGNPNEPRGSGPVLGLAVSEFTSNISRYSHYCSFQYSCTFTYITFYTARYCKEFARVL